MVAGHFCAVFVAIFSTIANATLYNPYELSLDCSSVYHCSLQINANMKDVLFFSTTHRDVFQEMLVDARAAQKFLDIDTTLLPQHQFCVKIGSQFFPTWGPLLTQIHDKNTIIKISETDLNLDLERIDVDRSDIRLASFLGFSSVTLTYDGKT